MFNISSLHPKSRSCRFDFDYYVNTLMQMSIDRVSRAKGIRGVSVERGVDIDEPGIKSFYVAMCHDYLNAMEDFMAAFMPHAVDLQGDIANYTNIQPIIQINEVELKR